MSDIDLNQAEHRYELGRDEERAIAVFKDEDGIRTFNHTVVPPALRGRGIASRLIAGALDDTRRAGLRVVPSCPFVARFIDANPAYRDLLA